MGWGSLLKATFRYGGRAVKATASSVGGAVIHPQRTIRGLGTATKTAAVGGAAAYVGWEKLTTDKSVARIVGDAVVGPETIDNVSDKVDGVANTVTELKESVGGAVDTMNNAMTSVDSKWSGMSNFLRGIFSGNGGDMFGNFFSNLGKGNVSGLSLAGLVLSALLVFGRFGWLGKIAGAVLGMMMIGNNANMSQVLGGGQQKPLAQDTPQRELPKPQAQVSSCQQNTCVNFLMRELGFSLLAAWRQCSVIPAKHIGITLPRIAEGEEASFVLVREGDKAAVIEKTVFMGTEYPFAEN